MEIPYTVKPRPDTGLYNAKVGIWLFLASEAMLFGGFFSAYVLLRVGAPDGLWPRGWLNVPLGTLNTILLITSSITITFAWAALRSNQFGRFKVFLGTTILLAITFLGIKSFEYRDKLTHYQVTLNSSRVVDGHLLERTAEEVVIHGVEADNPEVLIDRRSPEFKQLHHEEFTIPMKDVKSMRAYTPSMNTYLALYWTMTGLHALHLIGGILIMGYFWGPGSRMWQKEPEHFTNRIEVAGLYWHFVDLVWVFLFPVLYLL
jgi:cytochrome c oxidase subunit 3